MKKNNVAAAAFLLAAATLMSSCSKDPLSKLSTAETQIYITDYDSSAKFSTYKTFTISDSITVINNNQAVKETNPVDSVFIAAVKTNMLQYGYVQAAEGQSPDLAVNVSRVFNTTGVISYNDYWGYYGDFYDPYFWGYGGYPYYAPYSYNVYAITEGALSVDLLDLKNAATNKQINFLWTGIVRGEGIFDSTSAATEINALFAQSPYLKIN